MNDELVDKVIEIDREKIIIEELSLSPKDKEVLILIEASERRLLNTLSALYGVPAEKINRR